MTGFSAPTGFLLDEQLYLTGQKNKPLANALRRIEGLDPVQPDNTFVGRTRTLTIADSSEPKSVAEISDYGAKIIGAVKGPDSVDFGVQLVQDQRLYVTARSINLIKELRNYYWNHALDTSRYGISDVLSGKKSIFRVRRA